MAWLFLPPIQLLFQIFPGSLEFWQLDFVPPLGAPGLDFQT
jgi:hypothetical protein